MPKHTDDLEMEQRHFAIAAARLRSDGLNQSKIARRLKKSQSEISRMLDYAEKHGFLARAPAFLSQNITPTELLEVDRRFFLDEELRDALSELAPRGLHLNVQVLPVGDDDFARAAAGCAARLLLRANLVGVMWGRTMRRLVRHIGEQREFFDEAGGCEAQCIPLCGDPVHLMNQRLVQYSASHLAAELSQAIKPSRNHDQPSERGPCLVGVPAYMSRQLFARRGGMAATREEFVREIPGYRAIFGPTGDREPPLVDCVDTILSGMGIIVRDSDRVTLAPGPDATAAHEDTGDFIKERLTQEGLAPGILMRLVYGDIGGWLLEKQGLRDPRRRLVESLNQGWTGVTGDHFARVARNAKPNGIPGVILVAAGPLKAKMLRELVRGGFVNELLIDTSLANALKLLV